MNRVSMRLTVRVQYSKEDGSEFTDDELRQLRANLDYLPQYAFSVGAFTDDAHDVLVDSWDHDTTLPREVR